MQYQEFNGLEYQEDYLEYIKENKDLEKGFLLY